MSDKLHTNLRLLAEKAGYRVGKCTHTAPIMGCTEWSYGTSGDDENLTIRHMPWAGDGTLSADDVCTVETWFAKAGYVVTLWYDANGWQVICELPNVNKPVYKGKDLPEALAQAVVQLPDDRREQELAE